MLGPPDFVRRRPEPGLGFSINFCISTTSPAMQPLAAGNLDDLIGTSGATARYDSRDQKGHRPQAFRMSPPPAHAVIARKRLGYEMV